MKEALYKREGRANRREDNAQVNVCLLAYKLLTWVHIRIYMKNYSGAKLFLLRPESTIFDFFSRDFLANIEEVEF